MPLAAIEGEQQDAADEDAATDDEGHGRTDTLLEMLEDERNQEHEGAGNADEDRHKGSAKDAVGDERSRHHRCEQFETDGPLAHARLEGPDEGKQGEEDAGGRLRYQPAGLGECEANGADGEDRDARDYLVV